jgi:hypothetical protein
MALPGLVNMSTLATRSWKDAGDAPLRLASTAALAALISSPGSFWPSTFAISAALSPRAPASTIAIAVPIE